MTDKEIQNSKSRLLKEKERLEIEIRSLDRDLRQDQAGWGGEHAYENHLADIGTDTASRESDVSLEMNAQDLLARVTDALKRIESGSYGFCKVCGRRISIERLRAMPWADLCIDDKKREETAI